MRGDSVTFGVRTGKEIGQSFVVLDKSFLQAVTAQQLRYYVQHGWIFAVPEVLWHEHFRKWDKRRHANIVKLKGIEKTLILLPGIGEMFRAEGEKLKPASQVLSGKKITINPKFASGGEFFELDGETAKTANERSLEVEERLEILVAVWRDFKRIPALHDASPSDMAETVHELSLQVRDDRDDIRGFYRNHRGPNYPAPELIDEEWTLYRWIQVQLIAGLNFFASYGLATPFNREKLFHELLDLDYLIPALVVGGLACREKRIIDRFRLLRPDGIVLK